MAARYIRQTLHIHACDLYNFIGGSSGVCPPVRPRTGWITVDLKVNVNYSEDKIKFKNESFIWISLL